MTTTTGDGVLALFHMDPAAIRCPYPLFDQIREEEAVRYVPEIECFLVTRYDDIVHVPEPADVLVDHADRSGAGPPAGGRVEALLDEAELAAKLKKLRGGTRVLLSADPPDRQRQRKLVNRAFTPPKVKSLEPRIREVAEGLVDRFVDRGEVELVHEFGVLLPLTIIAECLGVDDDELPKFKRWSDDFVAAIGNHDMSKEQLRALLLSQREFYDYFAGRSPSAGPSRATT